MTMMIIFTVIMVICSANLSIAAPADLLEAPTEPVTVRIKMCTVDKKFIEDNISDDDCKKCQNTDPESKTMFNEQCRCKCTALNSYYDKIKASKPPMRIDGGQCSTCGDTTICHCNGINNGLQTNGEPWQSFAHHIAVLAFTYDNPAVFV